VAVTAAEVGSHLPGVVHRGGGGGSTPLHRAPSRPPPQSLHGAGADAGAEASNPPSAPAGAGGV